MDKLEVAIWGIKVSAEGYVGVLGAVLVVIIALSMIRRMRRSGDKTPDRMV